MLKYGLKELQKLGFKDVFGNSSANNMASDKIIIKNGGILINEVNGSKYYKIILL